MRLWFLIHCSCDTGTTEILFIIFGYFSGSRRCMAYFDEQEFLYEAPRTPYVRQTESWDRFCVLSD